MFLLRIGTGQDILTGVKRIAGIVHQLAEESLVYGLDKDVHQQLDKVDAQPAGKEGERDAQVYQSQLFQLLQGTHFDLQIAMFNQ